MKKSLLSVGAASMMLAMFATGCGTTGSNQIQEANDFIAGAQSYKVHKVQKDEMANVMLNISEQLYLLIGGAVADNIKIRFGESDVMLLMQEYGNADNYSKDWKAIKLNSADAKAANERILAGITTYLKDNQQYQKKTPAQAFDAVKNKLALGDFVAYGAAQKANDKEALDNYKGMEAWLEIGKKELNSCYGDAYKAAEAKRAKQMEESQARTKAEFERMGNKVKYLGVYIAVLGADEAIKNASNSMLKAGAERAKAAAVAEMQEIEKQYPYVKEVLDPILKLKTNEERVAYAKDLAAQYGYVLEIAGGRIAYTAKAMPWYFKSKEALDDASMNN